MLGRLQLYAAVGLAFVLALFGIYWRGKSDGAEAERDEQTRRRLDAMNTQKEVRDEIWDDIDLADRAGRWVRSNDDKR